MKKLLVAGVVIAAGMIVAGVWNQRAIAHLQKPLNPWPEWKPCCLVNADPDQFAIYTVNDEHTVTFWLYPGEDMGDTEFSLLWDLPAGVTIEDPALELSRNRETLEPSQFINQDPQDPMLFRVTLPTLRAGEFVQFSMGWPNAVMAHNKADVMIARDSNQVPFFGGWKP